MAKHIKNMDELARALQTIMLGMVDELAERVYETLNYFLQEYYNSYDRSHTGGNLIFCDQRLK